MRPGIERHNFFIIDGIDHLSLVTKLIKIAQPLLCEKIQHIESNGYFLQLTAVNIPCIISTGVGGQPATTTSTGITLDTRPKLA